MRPVLERALAEKNVIKTRPQAREFTDVPVIVVYRTLNSRQ